MSSAQYIEEVFGGPLPEDDEIDLDNFKQVIEDRLVQLENEATYAQKLVEKGKAGEAIDLELEFPNALDEIAQNEKEISMIVFVAANLYDKVDECQQTINNQASQIAGFDQKIEQIQNSKQTILQETEKKHHLIVNMEQMNIDLNAELQQLMTESRQNDKLLKNMEEINEQLQSNIDTNDQENHRKQQFHQLHIGELQHQLTDSLRNNQNLKNNQEQMKAYLLMKDDELVQKYIKLNKLTRVYQFMAEDKESLEKEILSKDKKLYDVENKFSDEILKSQVFEQKVQELQQVVKSLENLGHLAKNNFDKSLEFKITRNSLLALENQDLPMMKIKSLGPLKNIEEYEQSQNSEENNFFEPNSKLDSLQSSLKLQNDVQTKDQDTQTYMISCEYGTQTNNIHIDGFTQTKQVENISEKCQTERIKLKNKEIQTLKQHTVETGCNPQAEFKFGQEPKQVTLEFTNSFQSVQSITINEEPTVEIESPEFKIVNKKQSIIGKSILRRGTMINMNNFKNDMDSFNDFFSTTVNYKFKRQQTFVNKERPNYNVIKSFFKKRQVHTVDNLPRIGEQNEIAKYEKSVQCNFDDQKIRALQKAAEKNREEMERSFIMHQNINCLEQFVKLNTDEEDDLKKQIEQLEAENFKLKMNHTRKKTSLMEDY